MSSAHLEGAAMLINPRPLDGKLMLFDASFYLAPKQCIMAALKYFNYDDIQFKEQDSYFVHTSVIGLLTDSTEVDNDKVLKDIRESGEYDLLGDIDYLLPTHTDKREMRHPPYIEVCGIVKNVSKSLFSFEIHADQYSSFLKTHKKKTGIFCIHAFVPDTGKYKNKRPLPQEKSFVFVTGFLTTVLSNDNENGGAVFAIEVHDMVFGGRATLSNHPNAAETSSRKRKSRFNFDDDEEENVAGPSK